MTEQHGVMTDDEERYAFEHPIYEEEDPDAEAFDPRDLEATDVPEGGIVDDRDELDDVFGQWPDPAPEPIRDEVL